MSQRRSSARRGSQSGWGALILATLLSATPALAADTVSASASAHLNIWYRSSEGCPDASAFLARLGELGRHGKLASVGDPVDFVVTLAAGDGSSAGRLERQTERGTVAIRELRAERCQVVAEALALSLELAIEPDAVSQEGAAPATVIQPAPSVTVPASPGVASPPDSAELRRPASPAARAGAALHVGVQGTLTSGVAPAPAPGGALFLELGETGSNLAARLSAHGSDRSSSAAGARLDVGWFAARLEGCAGGWDTGTWWVRPCIGAEAGRLSVRREGTGGERDQGLWASALGLLRGGLQLGDHWLPEAEFGLGIPFTRYTVGSPRSTDLYRTDALVFHLALGMSWAP